VNELRLKFLLTAVLVGGLTGAANAAPWLCTLSDTLQVPAGRVTLKDISRTPVPASAAGVVLVPGGVPGTSTSLDRRIILRRLVAQGLAAGVVFRGAERTVLIFRGTVVDASRLRTIMTEALEPFLPEAETDAPATWLELEYQGGNLGADGTCTLTPMYKGTLRPGRQTVRFRFQDENRSRVVSTTVMVHHFARVARPARRIRRGETLHDGDFTWEWADLSGGAKGRFLGHRSVEGQTAARTLEPGDVLLEQDLKNPPVILAGDPVELRLGRGGVQVTVRAYARREGSLGQTIPVRNELTGQLVNARVTGPGTVEWRY